MNKKSHGGHRQNSGRKKKGYRTTTVAFRVREEIAVSFKIQTKAVAKRLTASLSDNSAQTSSNAPDKP